MPKVRFQGRIHPQVWNISIPNHPSILSISDKGTRVITTVSIDKDIVQVECEVDPYSEDKHFDDLHAQAYRLGKAAIDLVAFARGAGLALLLEECTTPDGRTSKLAFHIPALASSVSSITRKNGEQAIRLLLDEPQIALAVRDLGIAMSQFDMANISCGRAVDAIRAYFVPEGKSNKDGWPPMREALRISEDYLKTITEASIAHRHGHYIHISSEVTSDVLRKAWSVMDRFLHYRLNGNQPLPMAEFPELS